MSAATASRPARARNGEVHDGGVRGAPVVVTPGDPAGIGCEIALKAFAGGARGFCLMESPARVERLARELGIDARIDAIEGPGAWRGPGDRLSVIAIDWLDDARPGSPDHGNARIVIDSIARAARWARAGEAAAITTNPVNKAVLAAAGFEHPGHTEFLASLCRTRPGAPVMMLVGGGLRVVPVTIHMPLAEVAPSLCTRDIVDKSLVVADALRACFGCKRPRLAVCGLNPHAGEDGLMGHEDARVIAPAIETLQKAGIDAGGPHAADSLFHAAARESYDAVIAMYHDQALIPVKTLDFDGAVNVTLGLDIIRTSPDHGTAFDIAGKGIARPDSLVAAIRLAESMAAKGLAGAREQAGADRPAGGNDK